jgi:hypothetical protein
MGTRGAWDRFRQPYAAPSLQVGQAHRAPCKLTRCGSLPAKALSTCSLSNKGPQSAIAAPHGQHTAKLALSESDRQTKHPIQHAADCGLSLLHSVMYYCRVCFQSAVCILVFHAQDTRLHKNSTTTKQPCKCRIVNPVNVGLSATDFAAPTRYAAVTVRCALTSICVCCPHQQGQLVLGGVTPKPLLQVGLRLGIVVETLRLRKISTGPAISVGPPGNRSPQLLEHLRTAVDCMHVVCIQKATTRLHSSCLLRRLNLLCTKPFFASEPSSKGKQSCCNAKATHVDM